MISFKLQLTNWAGEGGKCCFRIFTSRLLSSSGCGSLIGLWNTLLDITRIRPFKTRINNYYYCPPISPLAPLWRCLRNVKCKCCDYWVTMCMLVMASQPPTDLQSSNNIQHRINIVPWCLIRTNRPLATVYRLTNDHSSFSFFFFFLLIISQKEQKPPQIQMFSATFRPGQICSSQQFSVARWWWWCVGGGSGGRAVAIPTPWKVYN